MCVHEIEILWEHFTVIYTSIAILLGDFARLQSIQTALQEVGVWCQTRTNAPCPFTGCGFVCFTVETICDRYAETPRSVGQCTMVFQKILQRKRGDTREAVHSVGPTSVCLFMVRICPPVCLVVTGGDSGSDRTPVDSVSINPFYG